MALHDLEHIDLFDSVRQMLSLMRNLLSKIDPYQLLFPIGLLQAVVGAGLWIAHAYFHTPYPGAAHAHHMFTGFLLSFAAGFLLTAVPKFIGSAVCSPLELSIAALIAISAIFIVSPLLPLFMLLFITVFAARRFKTRSFSPPPHFLFLPVGILLGIVGAAFLFLAEKEWIPLSFTGHGRVLLYFGTMLAFILGIGSKLVTALLGWTSLPTHRIENFNKPKKENELKIYVLPLVQASFFILSFVVEIAGWTTTGRIIRAAVATWIGFHYWRLYRLPQTPGKLPIWIWIAGWLMVLGLWIYALLPSYGVHAAHLFFIGGYGLMTLMISSRVILAHGGYPEKIELTSPIFTGTGVLVIIAMLTRFFANSMPESYVHHLAYAGITLVCALLIWGKFFLPKIFFRSSE